MFIFPGGYEFLIMAAIAFLLFGVPLIAVIVIVVVMNRRNRQAGFVDEPNAKGDEISSDEGLADEAEANE